MGSAQSAQRIQLGERSAVPVCEDLLLGPFPGRARPPPGAFPPWRCAVTGSGSAWKGWGRRWFTALAVSFTAPLACISPLPGAEDKVPAVPSLLPGRDGAPRPRCDVNRFGLSSVRTRMCRAARAGIGSRKLAPGVGGDVGNPPDPS